MPSVNEPFNMYSFYVETSIWSPLSLHMSMLSDKSTKSESSQISLVQVDLEQIKYTIKSTFLDQIEMQVTR